MASVQRPTVKVGDIIRVHVPELFGLWRVDEVVSAAGTWGWFLRISQEGGKISRIIAPRGFEIVSHADDDLRAEVRATMGELWPDLPFGRG